MSRIEGEVLVIGYGNPGRLDDGLGQAFAERVAALRLPGVTTETCYQLAVEHAELASRYDVVVFADAAAQGPEPFGFEPLEAETLVCFTTHCLDPRAVIGLARDVYGASPAGLMMGVRGYEFNEFEERLSRQAAENLDAAVHFFQSQRTTVVENGDHHESGKTRNSLCR